MDRKKLFIIGGLFIFSIAGLFFIQLRNRRVEKEEEIAEQISQDPISGRDLIQDETPVVDEPIEDLDAETGINFEKLSSEEISRSAASCLESMTNENGIYAFAKECSSQDNCQLLGANNQVPRLIWLWYQFYLKTGDQDYINKINRDLDNYLNNVSTIQNEAWNCKLVYPLWESKIFSQETEDKIKRICQYSTHLPPLEDQYAYLDADVPALFNFRLDLNRQNKSMIEKRIKSETQLRKLAFLSSDYLYKYYFTNKEGDLVMAEATYVQALNKYLLNKIDNKPEQKGEACVLGQAALDFYQETEDQKYLDYASYFWQNRQAGSLSEKAVCAFFADQLFQELGKDQYRVERESLVDDATQTNFDHPDYDGYFTGDGCFNKASQEKVSKFTTENCLISGLLLKN